jgi:sulfur relay protein TusB/DsrH
MLHLIQKSPFQSQCLNECLKIAGADDSFLLMLDGVYALQWPDFLNNKLVFNDFKNTDKQLPKITVLEDDLLARGLVIPETHKDSIVAINYTQFVELTLNNSKTLSWF